MTLSINKHLSREEIIKNGSFFTPEHIVKIARDWMKELILNDDFILDFGVGYGAFISEFYTLSKNMIATDIDDKSIAFVKELFPNVDAYVENSLLNISREKYQLDNDHRLVIVGNPPYNDITSQYKKGKKGNLEMDAIVVSRDLGVSFMKAYALLEPEYICILHPLSYLIKKTNFNSLKFFNDDYILEKGLIFSSNEFTSIRKSHMEFPISLSLYRRDRGNKMSFEYIKNFEFAILNNEKTFRMSNLETIDGKIAKYPRREGKEDEGLKFYTLRDINALKRNKTFLIGKSNNGIKITLELLYQYAWLDYFKNNFKGEKAFIYGNLSPLYSEKIETPIIKRELISYIYNNNRVVKEYIFNNDLTEELKRHYKIKKFVETYPGLKEIIRNMA